LLPKALSNPWLEEIRAQGADILQATNGDTKEEITRPINENEQNEEENQKLRKPPIKFLLITNLTHFFLSIHLLHFSTCFEQPSAHHQENKSVSIHNLVLSLCVYDCLVR
jgi:hypothetical protein